MKPRIYLDNNGSTAVDPKVIEAVVKALHTATGNPSSIHSFGQETRNSLIKARHTCASFLNVKPQEIVFNSGATEGLNMVIRGVLLKKPKSHIITSDAEHAAVYATLKEFASLGYEVSFMPAGLCGAVSPEAVREAIRPNTSLIALMAVNNETGVKTDIAAIAAIAKSEDIPFLVDAVALLGKESFSIPDGVSAACFSGHKIHAPKGVGFTFLRSGLKLMPSISGGEQEFGRRGGTENVPGVVGLARAVALLTEALPEASERMRMLRDLLENTLLEKIPNVLVNGEGPRVVNTSNLAFVGVEGESLITQLDMQGVAVSHGSACASGALEPSRVLLNMGLLPSIARASVRFSLSRFTTEAEIREGCEIIVKVVSKMLR